MGKDCNPVFLDAEGNYSETYYTTLATQGEKAATEAYIDEMLPVASEVKFEKAKPSPVDRLAKETDDFFKTGEYVGVTKVIDELGGGLPDIVIRALAINMKADDLMIQARIDGRKNYGEDEAKAEAREYFKVIPETNTPNAHVTEFNKYKDDVLSLHRTQRKFGDIIHKFLEHVFNEYHNTEAADREDRRMRFGIVQRARQRFYNDLDSDLKKVFSKAEVQNSLSKIAQSFMDDVRKFEKENDDVAEIFAEKAIKSNKIRLNDKKLGGKVDLLIVSRKTGKAMLYDFKTKSEDNLKNFDNIHAARMKPPFDTLHANAKTFADLQLTIYKKILEEEYGLDVVDAKIGIVVGAYAPEADTNKPGQRAWTLTRVNEQLSRMEKATLYSGALEVKADVEGKEKVIHEIDKSLDELFLNKWETNITNKDSYMEKQLARAVKKGNKYIWYDPRDNAKKEAKDLDQLKMFINKSYNELQRMKRSVAIDAKNMFLKGGDPPKNSIWASGGANYKALYNGVFKHAHPDHYDVIVPAEYKELAGMGDDILLLVNKVTKEVKVVSILPVINKVIDFHDTEDPNADPKKTIFGPWLTDEAAQKEFRNTAPRATTHELNILRLGVIAHKIRQSLPELGQITSIISATMFGKDNNVVERMPDDPMATWKEIADIYNDSESTEIPPLVKEMGEAPYIMPPNKLKESIVGNFVNMVINNSDPLKKVAGRRDKNVNSITKDIKNRITQLDDANESYEGDVKLMNLMEDYMKRLYNILYKSPDISSKDGVYTNEYYRQAREAYLAMKNMLNKKPSNYKVKPYSGMQSLMLMGDEDAEMLHFAIMEAEQAARDLITSFLSEHEVLLQNLMKKRGISLAKKITSGDISKQLFEPMLEDGFNFNPDNVENWMKFKDLDDLEFEEEREYVKFFNSKVKEFAKLGFGKGKYNAMYPDPDAHLTPGVPKWKEGYIPIMPQKASNVFNDTMLMARGMDTDVENTAASVKNLFKSFGKSVSKGIKKLAKPVEDGKRDTSEPWELKQLFVNQIDQSAGRGSYETRELLGIDENNKYVGGRKPIEMNPALVLNLFAVETSRQKFMSEAKMVHQAIDSKLAEEESAGLEGAKEKREALASIAQLRIDNMVKDEGAIGRMMDSVKRISSLSIFGGSFRQVVADFTTTQLQITSATIGAAISKTLFGHDNRFNGKDIAWAKKHMLSKFGQQMIVDYGMFNASLGEFTETDYNATMKNSMWQSKHMMAHFRTVLKKAIQDVILAQMHHDGITEDAFDVDEKTGRYIYNETKDDRFYVYSEELAKKGFGHSEPPDPDTDDYKKWKKWQAVREMLKSSRGIDEKTGRMKHPYSIRELNTMKQEAIRMFGAMDSSEAVVYEKQSVWRGLFTYRKWIIHRVANFYNKTEKTWRRGKWKEEKVGDDIEYKYVQDEIEGLVQSISGLAKDIYSYGWTGAVNNASDIRKENIGKLIGDMLMALLLYSVVSWMLGMEFENKAFVNELEKGWQNSLGDMFIPASAYYAVTSDAMPSLSMMGSFMKNTVTSVYYGVTGDAAKAMSSGDNALSLFGVYRTGKAFGFDKLILGEPID